jgi:hypothetical protein
MKLALYSFKSDLPREKVCQPGVEYEVFESDVGSDEAFAFFDKLNYPRDSFYLEAAECSLDFCKHEQAIWVEITSAEFWATSEVSCDEAKAIIETLYRGEMFSSHIPATSREWDAYALLGADRPADNAAI